MGSSDLWPLLHLEESSLCFLPCSIPPSCSGFGETAAREAGLKTTSNLNFTGGSLYQESGYLLGGVQGKDRAPNTNDYLQKWSCIIPTITKCQRLLRITLCSHRWSSLILKTSPCFKDTQLSLRRIWVTSQWYIAELGLEPKCVGLQRSSPMLYLLSCRVLVNISLWTQWAAKIG